MSTLNPKWVYEDQAVSRLKDAVRVHPGGQKGWAKDHGFSLTYVNSVYHGRQPISPKMANALGLERMTVFYEIGQ